MLSQPFSKRVWKRFIQEGVLDSYRLSNIISESWMRCRTKGVNPYEGKGCCLLTNEALLKRKRENALLLELAAPHIQTMYHSIHGISAMVLLIDPDGYVLLIKGDPAIVNQAKSINFVEGIRWTEDEVGTNAIGTTLASGESIMLVGAEHYAVASQDWNCAAAPIRDSDGRLLGVVDISWQGTEVNLGIHSSVVITAYAIEHEWQANEQRSLLELVGISSSMLLSGDCQIITDWKQRIVQIDKKVGIDHAQWLMKNVYELASEGQNILQKNPIYAPTTGRLIGFGFHIGDFAVKKQSFVSCSNGFVFNGERGASEVFAQTLRDAERIAWSDIPVYIEGESGTGKELIAKAIHQNSDRRFGPFVAVNCGAIPENFIQSELFGYADGAFTGASKGGHKGKFEQANGGTLFLDEIEAMPISMQVALLRVLQEKEVVPIGGLKAIPVNVRVVTATNRDLWQFARLGKFREDLLYRIHVVSIQIPPLRKHKEDIPSLIQHFCNERNIVIDLPDEVLHKLLHYDWPGNIRELFNALEHIHIKSMGQKPNVAHLPEYIIQFNEPTPHSSSMKVHSEKDVISFREQVQKQEIMQALKEAGGNVSNAARVLGIPRSTFYRRLQRFQL